MRTGSGEPGPPRCATVDQSCRREGSASRAAVSGRGSRRRSQNRCVSPLARPRPRRSRAARRGASLPSAFPHLDPELSDRTHAALAGFRRARRDGNGKRPYRFSSTLCLFPLSSFSIREKNPRDGQRRRPGTPARSLRSDPPLPHCPPCFLFIFPFLFTPQAESGAEARRVWWASWTESNRVFPLWFPGQGDGAGQRHRGARPGRTQPHTQCSRPTPPSRATRTGLRARAPALALRWSGGQGGREPRVPNGKRELFLRLPAVRAPATSGPCAPSAAGVHPGLELWERRTERASPRMASPLWAASPGGPHGSSPPKFVCPVRKGFPLQSTKAKRPG